MVMDRYDKEKEMVFVLFLVFYVDVISLAQISQGFILLLEFVDDFLVDIFDVVNVFVLFVVRAVVDDIFLFVFVIRVQKNFSEFFKGFKVV